MTRVPGLEIRVVPVGATSTSGSLAVLDGGSLLVPIAVAIPPPTSAPTAKHAAWIIVELAIAPAKCAGSYGADGRDGLLGHTIKALAPVPEPVSD